jgi:hypothetical protein
MVMVMHVPAHTVSLEVSSRTCTWRATAAYTKPAATLAMVAPAVRFGFWGLGFGVWGSALGFGVWGLGFGVLGVGGGVLGLGCGVWGVGFGVWGVGCGVWGVGCGVWDLGFGVYHHIWGTSVCRRVYRRLRRPGLWVRVSGVGF